MNVKIEGQQLSGGIESKANNRLWLVGILMLMFVTAVVSAIWPSDAGAPAANSNRDFLALNPEVRLFQRYAAAREADAAYIFNTRNPEVRQIQRFMLLTTIHSAPGLPPVMNPELRLVERYREIANRHDREFLATNPEVGAADRYREMKARE